MSIFNSNNNVQFLTDPLTSDSLQGGMFGVSSPQMVPIPGNGGMVSQMQNGIMPGEWDWLNGAKQGNMGLPSAVDMSKILNPEQAAIPQASAGNSNVGSVNGKNMQGKAVARSLVPMPSFSSFVNANPMKG